MSLLALIAIVPGGLTSLPTPVGADGEMPPFLRRLIGEQRVRRWFEVRDQIRHLDDVCRGMGFQYVTAAWSDAETIGRRSLTASVEAYVWLDDAGQDVADDALVQLTPAGVTPVRGHSIRWLIADGHALLHHAGELVGGLFGCVIACDDGLWFDRCEVELAHLRFGNSAGVTMTFVCSICAASVGSCSHGLDEAYDVTVSLVDGVCSICGEPCSEHWDGQVVRVIASPRPADLVLHEISLVPRPRDPLCRIEARSIDADQLVGHLGRSPRPGDVVWDHGCMYPCGGFSPLPLDP